MTSERSQSENATYCVDSNQKTFWKRQNHGDSEKTSGCYEVGGERRWDEQDFYGSETVLYDIVMVDRMCVKVAQSCWTLYNRVDYTVHGVLQATVLEWVAFTVKYIVQLLYHNYTVMVGI